MHKQPNTTPKTKQQRKNEETIQARWMSVDAVHAFLGGILSRSEVERLMKENHIPARWVKNRLSADRRDVEQWVDDIRRAKTPETTRLLGADFIVPVSYILQSETGRRAA